MKKRNKPNNQNVNYRNARRTVCAASGGQKWVFHSKGAAMNAARTYLYTTLRFENEKRIARAYYCKACGGWHLTKMDLEQWNDRRREINRLRMTT